MLPHAEKNVDVVIIGGGPAGSIAGAVLAQRGRKVLCLEREVFPRFVIGESLLPRSTQLLAEAGLLEAVEARGYQVKPGATFWRDGRSERFAFAAGLPGTRPTAFQVPRADFDQTLSLRAAELGVEVRFGHQVDEVGFWPGGAQVTARALATGEAVEVGAKFVLDCSGYGRVLPRLLGVDRPPSFAPRVAVFTHVEGDRRPPGPEAGDIWVCVHPNGSWIWIIPFSDGRTSVGVVGTPQVIDAAGENDEARLWAHLRSEPAAAGRVGQATPVIPMRRISGYSTAVERLHGHRWALTGNAGTFLDPVFSSGVTLALESSSLAARLIDRQLGGGAVDWEREYAAEVNRATAVFAAFVRGWYSGELIDVLFTEAPPEGVKAAITSVLAGYVLDSSNSLVRDPEQRLKTLHQSLLRNQKPRSTVSPELVSTKSIGGVTDGS
ncbi:MAG: NAD(P)/FAD-dependent oxidoreductase [Myxococcaceae bacterium]